MIIQQSTIRGELINKLIFYNTYDDTIIKFEFDKLLGLTFREQEKLDDFLKLLNIEEKYDYKQYLRDLILVGEVSFEIIIHEDYTYSLTY